MLEKALLKSQRLSGIKYRGEEFDEFETTFNIPEGNKEDFSLPLYGYTVNPFILDFLKNKEYLLNAQKVKYWRMVLN